MTPIVVLGMHKSGTSMISEILHHSGIQMVEEDGPLPGYEDKFHHERRITREINKDLLNAHGQYSLDTTERPDLTGIDADLRRAAAGFVSSMAERGVDWGFKDPRTCLTYEFWRGILPRHKLVCVFRDAGEVLEHYRKVRKGDDFRTLRAWYRHNQAMLAAFERCPEDDRLMIHYRDFMDGDRGLTALSEFLGRPLRDRRSHHLMRSRRGSWLAFGAKTFIHRFRTGQNVRTLNRRLRRIAAASGS